MILKTTLDMNKPDKNVRILLVGERGVGKTSMIFSLVYEEFKETVPPRCDEIIIPPEVTPVHISTEIVDFSEQEQTEEDLEIEVKKASVICIVYAVDNDVSQEKISSHWLPYLRKVLGEDHDTPVILVGNKSDLLYGNYNSIDSVLPLMNQFKEIELCVECSSKNLDNLSEIYYFAQKTVLYPVSPIYCPEERDLSESCKIALKRIFKLCDLDNDGVLNDFELNQFQTFCFGSFLLSQTLDEVKLILKSIIPDGVHGNGITLTGFLFLLTFFIQRGRHELIWIALHKYGYNNLVNFNEEYLNPKISIPKGSTVELSPQGYSFFSNLFTKYDKDNDNALSPAELALMFSICDVPPKWYQTDYTQIVQTNEKGWITFQGFLSIWTLTTSIDHRETLKYLAYFGYMTVSGEKDQLSAIYITKDKRIDLNEKQTSRNVFSCRLIGPKNAGKSMFLKRFIDKLGNATQTRRGANSYKNENIYNNYVINNINIYGQKKYLIIKEIDVLNVDIPLIEPELFCDVSCLMFDQSDPKSFECVAKIYINNFYNTKLPILFVASKSDQQAVRQDYEMQPEEFCSHYKLTPLHKFSSYSDKESLNMEVYEKLGTMAAYPNLNRLVHLLMMKPSNSWMAQNVNLLQRCLPHNHRITLLQTGLGVTSFALLGFFILRFLRLNLNN